MVYKCCAYGCRSGCDGSVPQNVSFHKFPPNKALRRKWIQRIARANFTPTNSHRLCSLHFSETDFLSARKDKNKSRARKKPKTPRRRLLKEGALPSIFEGVPSCMAYSPVSYRQTDVTSSARHDMAFTRMEQEAEDFLNNDRVACIDDIMDQINRVTTWPKEFLFHNDVSTSKLFIFQMDFTSGSPLVVANITISDDLTVSVTWKQRPVRPAEYCHLFKGKLSLFSQLLNLAVLLLSWSDSYLTPKSYITMAINCLKDFSASCDSDEMKRPIEFYIEQLELLQTNKHARRYSDSLIVFAFVVYSISSNAYSSMANQSVIQLPSTRLLKRISNQQKASSGIIVSGYLKLRVSRLNEMERHVILIIDEIYIAKRIELSGGAIIGAQGYDEAGIPSTVLCFMAKSLCNSYRDIVAMFPLKRMSLDTLRECYLQVMKLLHDVGFTTVAICLDNLSTNRAFYKSLSDDGNLNPEVRHPVTGNPLFLIIDPVHNMKNIFNNFQRRRLFKCPAAPPILQEDCRATFEHLIELMKYEKNHALRKAHKLSEASLYPRNGFKTSVKPSVSVFCESTRDALMYYSQEEEHKDWKSTATFISIIVKLWHILNVKTSSIGKRKRDMNIDPVTSSNDWKLDFLMEFEYFLKLWEEQKQFGLTTETFTAVRLTCKSLVLLSRHLLDTCGFKYVLLGNIQSDWLEGRFSWYRQCAGANYYLSLRQVFEGETKVRTLSLLKFSGFSRQEIDEALSDDTNRQDVEMQDSNNPESEETQHDNYLSEISGLLKEEADYRADSSEISTCFYCTGAIIKSILNFTKCQFCREILVTDDDDQEPSPPSATYIRQVNRGGLLMPSDFAFSLCLRAYCLFQRLVKNDELLKKFQISRKKQSESFLTIFSDALEDDNQFLSDIIHLCTCSKGHNILKHFTRRFFNTVTKLHVKSVSEGQSAASASRKIKKLSGST